MQKGREKNRTLTPTQMQIMNNVTDCEKHSEGREVVYDENVKVGMQTFDNLEKRVRILEAFIKMETANQNLEYEQKKKEKKPNSKEKQNPKN